MNRFFSVSAWLVGVATLAFIGYAFLRYLEPDPLASPLVLFASYDSGVGGTRLEFRADGTYRYENAAFIAEDVITGRYTRTDSLIRLDRLPKVGMLKRHTLLVRPSPATETGHGIWQVGATGLVDSSLAVFTIFPLIPAK